MSDTPTPAEIAAAHSPDVVLGNKWICTAIGCDWSLRTNDRIKGRQGHAEHVIAALSEHYHLLPKVEPYPDDTVHPYWVATDVDGPQVVKVTDSDDSCDENWVGIEFSARWRTVDVATARRLASMFASAADVAEEPK
ncbi:hypothetical protein HOV03_gp76 [Gordonia phage Asapag]|uniref:Uncharacterized protein n=1 Tax=Gordonia phage Asapag TaxID=2507862 RepID=A0A410TDW3_9CAUD|nr:hypothetical protein HOV03_gp76 [Gordonia phage Asapag]QAU07216.1 hypothetical protein SEA_ASAPAG_76 [Gordonia phage Asapag]